MLFVLVLFLLSDKLMKIDIISQMVGQDVKEMEREDDLSVQLVARMSFILFCFHVFIFIVTLARNEMAAHFHDGCWCFKYMLVAIGFFASWWIDSSFFKLYYLPAAKFISASFLIWQVFIIIASSYIINKRLVKNAVEDDSNCSANILLLVTVFLLAFDVFMIVRSFYMFACNSAIWIQSLTIVFIVMMFILQMIGKSRPSSSILTHFLVAFYCLYLQWTALSSSSDEACNANYGSSGNSLRQIFFGMAWTIFALFFYIANMSTEDMEEIK